MHCPACGDQSSKVLESRIADAGDAMRRRRECLSCNERFTTYERIEQPTLWVTKHDNSHEAFCPDKLLRGLSIACSKRAVATSELEALVAAVEHELRQGGCKQVTSDEVGAAALAGLVRIDEAAAIRFASVIEGAASLASFRDVLDRMAAALAQASDHEHHQHDAEHEYEHQRRGPAGAIARTPVAV
jgi:transcriptional repressor NrdR